MALRRLDWRKHWRENCTCRHRQRIPTFGKSVKTQAALTLDPKIVLALLMLGYRDALATDNDRIYGALA
jgi:hypothetical protein